MNSENVKTGKEVKEALEKARERSKALGKAIDAAEKRRPAKPDHADDGGVF